MCARPNTELTIPSLRAFHPHDGRIASAGRKGAVRRGLPCRAQTLARCVHQACRVAEDDDCLRASAIVLCTDSVEQPSLRLFVVRFAKDLLGLRGNGVHDSPISVRMPIFLATVTWGSILRHAGRQESVAYDSVPE